METGPDILRFGIPSLDRLLGHPEAEKGSTRRYGVALEGHSTTVCIIGTGGAGKSELALHMASRYAADAQKSAKPGVVRTFYLSTDLSHGKAEAIWRRFRLDEPNDRRNPLENADYKPDGLRVSLSNHEISKVEDVDKLAAPPANSAWLTEVTFVDLHRSSSDDEWGALTRLVETLRDTKATPKQLLIIDAAQGLDTLVEKSDQAQGLRSRRSRIKRLLSLAKNRCHIVLVVEARERDEGFHEESISDLVVRLREVEVNGYQRRTVAIEKLRGQPYVRGQHPIKFRSGRGSKTIKGHSTAASEHNGKYLQNQDGPEVPHDGGGQTRRNQGQAYKHQSYIQVYSSLDAVNRSSTNAESRVHRDILKWAVRPIWC